MSPKYEPKKFLKENIKALTQPEARHINLYSSLDSLRDRIAQARQETDERPRKTLFREEIFTEEVTIIKSTPLDYAGLSFCVAWELQGFRQVPQMLPYTFEALPRFWT